MSHYIQDTYTNSSQNKKGPQLWDPPHLMMVYDNRQLQLICHVRWLQLSEPYMYCLFQCIHTTMSPFYIRLPQPLWFNMTAILSHTSNMSSRIELYAFDWVRLKHKIYQLLHVFKSITPRKALLCLRFLIWDHQTWFSRAKLFFLEFQS